MEQDSIEDILAHWGIKGMKWGVRKDRSSDGGSDMKKALRAWDEGVSSRKNLTRAMNQASKEMNETHLPRINKKYETLDVKDPKTYTEYFKEVSEAYSDSATKAFGNIVPLTSPDGKNHVSIFMNQNMEVGFKMTDSAGKDVNRALYRLDH